MPKLLVATTNQGKIQEVTTILAELPYQITTPLDQHINTFDVEETGDTFFENAVLKAKAYANQAQLSTIADDSGLLVDALGGRPGVFSKRYGDNDHHRNLKLLQELASIPESKRTARFICVICLFDFPHQLPIVTQGQVEGRISLQIKGTSGFGYDPVFIPTELMGNTKTFAELGPEIKNQISHRARALDQLKQHLQKTPLC